MSLITDAAQAALSQRAAVSAWRNGRPWEADCPRCGLSWRITATGLLARHGPPLQPCTGSGAMVSGGIYDLVDGSEVSP
jgi:hypothetical protein